ncbi:MULTISPECIES: hypothetical protein [unclassified Polaribacter]|uniref:hypothetical protein n=1 Tax=unclassified Polaribacter TaxID=196858 RepID=UPI000068C5FD|nr:hypothetical protein [Polaribacter sp. MED152]EAQ42138.1 hypothetical protein MED152_05450 [Polaribacter sp. MED152]
MKTKKIDTKKITKKVEKTFNNVKTAGEKANNYALNTTEKVVTETIDLASQLQKITDKALKRRIELLGNKQNLMFDTLEAYKKQLLKGKKKLRKAFA